MNNLNTRIILINQYFRLFFKCYTPPISILYIHQFSRRCLLFCSSCCGVLLFCSSCCGDRSDIGSWRSRSCCVILYRATFVGRGRDRLSEHAWLSVERLWDVTNMLRRANQTTKNRIEHVLS